MTVGIGGTAAASPSPGYTASLIPTGEEGYWSAVNPDTNTAYISDITADELSVINGNTNTVTATIALGAPPHGIAVDPATDTVYVSVAGNASTSAAALDVINGATDAVTDTIALPAGSDPIGVAVDSLTDVVYATEYEASAVAVIDGSTNTVTTTVDTGTGTHPWGIAVDESSDVAWVGDFSGNVFGISGTSNTVTQTVTFSGAAVAGVDVDPDTDTVYAAIQSRPAVAVIDGSTGAISTTISVTEPFYSVAVDPGSGTVFASSDESSGGYGTTWVIDESSNSIVDTIPRGGLVMAVDTATGSAYVPSESGDTKAAWVLTPSAANALSPIIESTSTTFTVGTDTSFTILGSALPAATYTETGTLPSGVTLSSSGVLSGTPAPGTAGSYPITLTASNGIPPDYSQAFTLTVDAASEAPAITSANQATFYAGAPNAFNVTATGYPAPSFSETGTLPPGVTFNTVYGLLSGAPPASSTAGVYPIQVTATNSLGTATQAFTLTTEPQNATFVSLPGVRVLDTRNDIGGYDTPVGPGQTLTLQLTGTQGLPASGVTAVVLNVTATDPTASSYVTVYPDGQARPTASSLNFTAGETIPNLVTVPVGADGAVDFYNNSGSVELIADLEGWYTTSESESLFVAAGPSRMLDTRDGTGGYSGPVGPGGTISLQVTGVDGVPSTGVYAVVLNVTATDPTASSYVTVYPDGEATPIASDLNFTAGETIPNLVVAEVGADGKIDFYNHTGSVELVADLAGYYGTTSTSSYVALSPVRVLDTRNGTGGYTTPVGPDGMISLPMTGVDGLPPSGVTAVVLNVTATDPTASSYVTVYPDGETRPTASNLNFTAEETIPNQVVVPVGADGAIDFYNHVGSVDLVADLAGFFTTAQSYLDASSLAESGPRP